MKIVKRPEFLAMPAGTLYSPYEHCAFGDMAIKGDTLPNGNDWFYQQIADTIAHHDSGEFADKLFEAAETGKSLALDFHMEGRDGCFDPPETMYAVWELADVLALIERLKESLGSGSERPTS